MINYVAFICRVFFLITRRQSRSTLFLFNAPATSEISTLSLRDALPIWVHVQQFLDRVGPGGPHDRALHGAGRDARRGLHRSEEHTSQLQSRLHLVCRLLLEKKKKK